MVSYRVENVSTCTKCDVRLRRTKRRQDPGHWWRHEHVFQNREIGSIQETHGCVLWLARQGQDEERSNLAVKTEQTIKIEADEEDEDANTVRDFTQTAPQGDHAQTEPMGSVSQSQGWSTHSIR